MLSRKLAGALPSLASVHRAGPSALALGLRARSSIAHPPPTASVKPILQPLAVALTPSLKALPGDPKPDDAVVVLDPSVFNHPIRRDILHLCAVQHLDGLRQGSANTKTRGEVKGSMRKIRPQKGTGRARLGDIKSPMLRGGGVAFGPKPRDFSTKLPRKVIQLGMRIALSAKVKERHFGVMARLDWPNGKTKHLQQKLDILGLRKTLFITGEEKIALGLERAIRNLRYSAVTKADEVNVYELLKWERIVLDVKAVEYFENTLKKDVAIAPLEISTELLEQQAPGTSEAVSA